ncbi:MAG: hypothetical protein OXB86_01960, partial [Bdellovibrionales bacterium]|nr:hypothetical protein [Bdellovibrionales bacterium]
EILQKKGIKTQTEYWEKRKSDPELQLLPFNLPHAYNMKWKDIQRLMGLIKPPIEKVAEILQKKGIKTQTEYWEKRKSDPELQLLPFNLPRDYNVEWAEIQRLMGLDALKRVSNKDQPPIEEVVKILKRKGIKTQTKYLEKRKSDPELQKLPRRLTEAYNMKWEDIQRLMGFDVPTRVTKKSQPPIEKVAKILRRKSIISEPQYKELRKSDPELQRLPRSLPQAYNMKWSDIQKLVGLKAVVRTEDHSLEEVIKILQRKGLKLESKYLEKRKSDPELQLLPRSLPQAYNIKWKDIQRLAGLTKPPIEKVAEILRRKGIKTESQYKKQRKSDKELQQLPSKLPAAYKMKWSEIKSSSSK